MLVGENVFAAMERLLVSRRCAAFCPHPADGRPLKVIPLSRGRIGGIYQATGTTVLKDIAKADVRLYRLNLGQLRGDLAHSLDLIVDSELIRATAGNMLGVLNIATGRPIPVFMLFSPTQQAAAHEIARMVLANKTGFLLLVPAQPHLDRVLSGEDNRGMRDGGVPGRHSPG